MAGAGILSWPARPPPSRTFKTATYDLLIAGPAALKSLILLIMMIVPPRSLVAALR